MIILNAIASPAARESGSFGRPLDKGLAGIFANADAAAGLRDARRLAALRTTVVAPGMPDQAVELTARPAHILKHRLFGQSCPRTRPQRYDNLTHSERERLAQQSPLGASRRGDVKVPAVHRERPEPTDVGDGVIDPIETERAQRTGKLRRKKRP